MRILFLGNNWVGLEVLKWLKQEGENVVGLIIHPEERRKYGEEIVGISGLASHQIFSGDALSDPQTMESIRNLEPSIGISALFGYILTNEFLSSFPSGCLNLHPAFLPYNRGQYPNVWSIIDRTPAGATLHYIDNGIDTGDIVGQRQISVTPTDTGESLYYRLEQTCVDLFRDMWPMIRSGYITRTPQSQQTSTYHQTKDTNRVDAIDLDKNYLARDLINILRARTFPPYNGAYFEEDGTRVYMRLELYES